MKVIDTGLNLYPLESLKANRKEVEGVTLPPIYASFQNTFKLGKSQQLVAHVYFDERYNEKLGVARCINEKFPDHIFFGGLFLPNESIEVMKRVYNQDDPIRSQDLFLIGEDASGHNFFFVGTGALNKDQIFIESGDLSFPGGERVTKIFDNIFQFMRSFLIVEIENGIGYGVEYNQLYKNWGEDFWRVKK
jgi:hypothetical protein